MDALVRLTLEPRGAWTTPWQADSLHGALACMWARFRGTASLRRDFLEPWMDNDPPFVLSDAFPEGSLPAPIVLPLFWDWPQERRKEIKRCLWMTHDQFRDLQNGGQPDIPHGGNGSSASVRHHVRMGNSVGRGPSSAGADSVRLFEVPYSTLSRSGRGLAVFARASRTGLALLLESMDMLGKIGFGADASVGHGAFQLRGDPVPFPELDDVPGADGFVSLSTHQPASADPTDGYWRAFVKYGKLAPEFHDSGAIFKRPQVMLAPGSCFRTDAHPKPFYGNCVRADDLLSDRDRETLAVRGVHPVQAAFALAVPIRWTTPEYES